MDAGVRRCHEVTIPSVRRCPCLAEVPIPYAQLRLALFLVYVCPFELFSIVLLDVSQWRFPNKFVFVAHLTTNQGAGRHFKFERTGKYTCSVRETDHQSIDCHLMGFDVNTNNELALREDIQSASSHSIIGSRQ